VITERNILSESASAEGSSKLVDEASCVAGRLSHNEEERYIAVMKELQFGEPMEDYAYFNC